MKKILFISILSLIVIVSCSEKTSNPISSTDAEAPSAVTDLSVGFTTNNSATLFLTATGDDGIFGRAKKYEVRYSTSFIDSANYELATKFLPANQPNVGTADDTIIVTGLLGDTKYYFAVKLADEVPNWSPISNIDSTRTLLSGNWTIYREDNSELISNRILDIDFDGLTKYIVTINGVSKFDNSIWTSIYESVRMTIDTSVLVNDTTIDTVFLNNPNAVHSIAIESSSKIWLGTINSGVALLEGGSTVFYQSNDSGSLLTVKDLLISQNKLWVGTQTNGLHSFALDGSNIWEQYKIPINSPFNGDGEINCLEVDATNAVWSGLLLFGTTVLDNSILTNYNSVDNFTSQTVWDIEAFGSQLIFGTDAGVFIFENNSWTNYTASSGLPENAVSSVAVDNQGMYWFGTRSGLVSFDGTEWQLYNTTNSYLPDNYVRTLNVDTFGNLWIGTNNGLAVFTK